MRNATCAASPWSVSNGRAVGPVAADDDRVDAEHADQAVHALPGVRRGVDEGAWVDDQRAPAAGQVALVVHGRQAGAGGETDPQVGSDVPAGRMPGPPGGQQLARDSPRRRPTTAAGRRRRVAGIAGRRPGRPGMHEDRAIRGGGHRQRRRPAGPPRPGWRARSRGSAARRSPSASRPARPARSGSCPGDRRPGLEVRRQCRGPLVPGGQQRRGLIGGRDPRCPAGWTGRARSGRGPARGACAGS